MRVDNKKCAICGRPATVNLTNTGESYCEVCIQRVLSVPVLKRVIMEFNNSLRTI